MLTKLLFRLFGKTVPYTICTMGPSAVFRYMKGDDVFDEI